MSGFLKLPSGAFLPKVGFGTWKISSNAAADLVYKAIRAGYPLIDCAAIYQNEKEVGKGINRAMSEGLVTRDKLFITSKLWNVDHAPNDVKPAVKRTLRDLQLEYLDLYLMHFPVAWPNVRTDEEAYPADYSSEYRGVQTKTTVFDTYKAMEELVSEGLVKDIGVSNFSCSLIWELDKVASVPIASNQFECHPFLPQSNLVDLCQSKGISVTAYSSFGSPSYKNWAIYDDSLPDALTDPAVVEIANKYGKTTAQILLAWATNYRNMAVIPKTANEMRLVENLNILDIELDENDIAALDTLDSGLRFNDQGPLWGIPIH